LVQPRVAEFARVCSYDRAGVGESDPASTPRTSADVVADLYALLGAAGVPEPYVLVGSSFGSMVIRLFASTYPEEIAGLVLVDA
jgi:pimeloyl-ACP methyl ester carboxylesterase